jgi:hypothetical protein
MLLEDAVLKAYEEMVAGLENIQMAGKHLLRIICEITILLTTIDMLTNESTH